MNIFRSTICSVREHFTQPIEQLRRHENFLSVALGVLRQVEAHLSFYQPRDGVACITAFFRATSSLQDDFPLDTLIAQFEAVNYGQYDELLRHLRRLSEHVSRTGREKHGVNRTKKGEMVTDENVWLGGVYGTFTHPVSFWRSKRTDEPNRQAVAFWAAQFIDSHLGCLIEDLTYVRDQVKWQPAIGHYPARNLSRR